jgi:predicted aldo/keto reductase-like oxidoreductase
MNYRPFGSTGWSCSALGFGTMRLPTRNGGAAIDERRATEMLEYAIDSGVNYVDTAYPYHNGQSEPFLGKVLRHGNRERIHLATKLPTWMVKSLAGCDRLLDEQLTRLRTDTLDLYLLHALNEETWGTVRTLDVLDWLAARKEEGVVRHVGFSFHDTLDVFTEILEETDLWSFCQIQYNFMDVEYQAGIQGLRLAHERGLAVVVMEPLHGGQLAKRVPGPVRDIWTRAGRPWDAVEWALRWVWNHPEVSVVLSGMSSLEQVRQNVSIASMAKGGALSAADLRAVDQVRKTYKSLSPIRCTACGYCQPCPNGVVIPRILELYSNAVMYQEPEESRADYLGLSDDERADLCVECGACEQICPQQIDIVNQLKTAHTFFTGSTAQGDAARATDL